MKDMYAYKEQKEHGRNIDFSIYSSFIVFTVLVFIFFQSMYTMTPKTSIPCREYLPISPLNV